MCALNIKIYYPVLQKHAYYCGLLDVEESLIMVIMRYAVYGVTGGGKSGSCEYSKISI